MNTLPSMLADRVVVVSSGLGVVLVIVLIVLLWPGPAVNGTPAPRVNLLWFVLLIVLILLVVGLIP